MGTSKPNPAALAGWVKSTDPRSGRSFFANHITRKTQWDPPDNWIEEIVEDDDGPPPFSAVASNPEEEDPLPSNWERMRDPSSGKFFYVDHENKITTWTRPTSSSSNNTNTTASSTLRRILSSQRSGGDIDQVSKPSSAPTASYKSQSSSSSSYDAPYRSPASQQPSYSAVTTSSLAAVAYHPTSTRSYQHEATYYSNMTSSTSSALVDFSDALPALDFKVLKVQDSLRPTCPHCKAIFSLSKRRHHCRLCGDVFCDACSDHRATLPLEGSEFEKPVRVCDFCFTDVNAGNFFSMRRYLTPLQLYQGQDQDDDASSTTSNVATAANVNAALYALTNDLDQLMHNASSFEERVTIPAHILVPCLTQHLERIATRDRAMVALASLLALGSLVGKCDLAHAVFRQKRRQQIIDDILTLLERSGSDRKTLYVQEQAARTIYYLTEPDTVKRLLQQPSQSSSANNSEYDQEDEDQDDPSLKVRALDLHRTLRNMLDHSSMSKNPNLQRWSAATIRNLIAEDERRTCMALNEQAAALATGDPASANSDYESFLDSLVSTGGIMILCSLMGTEDSDTRAHAMGSLGAVLSATRAIQASRNALAEMTGNRSKKSRSSETEGVATMVLRAIVASGGCGSSVSQLLLSADNVVASMGCNFCASLAVPILTNPRGSATLPYHYDCTNHGNSSMGGNSEDDDDLDLDACREAALEMATGSCLPALLSLVRDSSLVSRPMELKKSAMETLAAICVAVGEMGKSWADGMYEEGIMEKAEAPVKLKQAISHLNEEGIVGGALEVLQASQSLGATGKDTPTARLREAAGIVLASMTSCSAEAIMQCSNDMAALLAVDASMTTPSALRGDGAPKCTGLLEAAAAVLIFSWQNHSGASSNLLDRLIDVIDSGAVGYLSRVLAIPTDWEAKDKAVGSMKAKSAACKLLCAMFGIANHNENNDDSSKSAKTTSIGLRRLMEAVDADSYAYRSGRDKNAPSNIMEAALATLYTASIHARNSLMGQTNNGAHYRAALMDLLEAAVLASSSMCGSSIAPGGDHGTFVKGDQFLVNRKDEFQKRRQDACKIACDVVIRGGKGGPALLPAMLIGGYGEGTVLASIRLALAIAQNGNQEQHAKLALCGILVPISDLLRTALDRGDLYKFSASLALVRFCGPHIAAGEGGGLASVQDAIRVATTVLTMPLNPHASEEQVEVQEALKSECISAVESLSSNSSLWTCISKDALPAIVYFLQNSCEIGESTKRGRETRCAALRAVLKIVQVPSHAVAAAEAGLPEPLGIMLKNGSRKPSAGREDDVIMLSLEVLHVLASQSESRRAAQLIDSGILRSVCSILGSSATDKVNQPNDIRADITFLGLEIVQLILSDVEGIGTAEQVLQSQAAVAFLDAVAAEAAFVQALCATMLLKTNMQIRRNDAEDGDESATYDIPKIYGPPLVLIQEKCGGFAGTHEAARAILFTLAVYACAIESRRSQTFWKTALLDGVKDDEDPPERASAAFCAHFLSLLSDDAGPFVPSDPRKKAEYERIRRPLVRHRLLEGLMKCLEAATPTYGEPDVFMLSLLVHFGLPQICLALWKDPALLEISFGLIESMVKMDPDEVIPLFVESKAAMLSLFDLLNLNKSSKSTLDTNEVRRFLTSVLGTLADNGLLTAAVHRHGVRSSAIGALAAACLMEEETSNDDEEEMASSRLSSGLMKCLVEICSINTGETSAKRSIELSSFEAEAIAKNLGKKVCQMVILRFIERAKLQQYEMEEEEDIMDAPDVAMLCAVAQHEVGLTILRSLGGLHALSLIAAEGEPAAVAALQMASKDNPSILLEADGHLSVLALFSKENGSSWRGKPESARKLETAAFDLLAQLCFASQKGRQAVSTAEHFSECLEKAVKTISCLLPSPANGVEVVPEDEIANEESHDKADVLPDGSVEPEGNEEGKDQNATNGIGTDQSKLETAEDHDLEEEKAENTKTSEGEQTKEEPKHLVPERSAAPREMVTTSKQEKPSTEQVVSIDEDTVTLGFPDSKLEVATIGFMSSLIQVKNIRNDILSNRPFVRACCALASYLNDFELQQEAVSFLVKLAPFVSSEASGLALSTELLAATFLNVMRSEQQTNPKQALSTPARLQSYVVSGLLCIFDCLAPDTQVNIIREIVSRLNIIIKGCAVARSAKSELQNGRDIGELACNLSYLMLNARVLLLSGKIVSPQLLSTLVHVIQWRFDPKTVLQDVEIRFWNATATHCVILISSFVIGNQQSLDAVGIKLGDISGSVLMVARPGKAPRKAIDFSSALQKLIEVGDATAAVSAQRILDRFAVA